MVTIQSDQNNIMVFYKLAFPNGLTVIISASPLSPEVGREILGRWTEDYTLLTMHQPVGRAFPFLRGVRIGEEYIRSNLNVDPPISSLLFDLLPRLTSLDLPDLIVQDAQTWYDRFYSAQPPLPI